MPIKQKNLGHTSTSQAFLNYYYYISRKSKWSTSRRRWTPPLNSKGWTGEGSRWWGTRKVRRKKGGFKWENGGFLHYFISEPWWPFSRLKLVVFLAELQFFFALGLLGPLPFFLLLREAIFAALLVFPVSQTKFSCCVFLR